MNLARRPRALGLLGATALLLTGFVVTGPPSHAADPTPFIVLGTSDVSDSNLMKAVLEPGFEAANPQYDLQYVPNGTGVAIDLAKAGNGSALIVHAAGLENQFVSPPTGPSYSLEKYGRAIFWGDFVLLGPQEDPAGVMTGTDPSHDVVTAFEKIAAAGADGKATFVSRGGTPGTTIQEHQIWAQTDSAKVSKCDVSQVNGLGQTPSTSTGACQSPVPLPGWYKSTGLKQAANVIAGDTCTLDGAIPKGCYVFTDRGTYNYLQTQGTVPNLKTVVRDNSADARGGDTELVNSFHAYAVNPAAVPANSVIDTVAATKFLDYLTSPATQAAVGAYLNASGDAPFLPSATPKFTLDGHSDTVDAGKFLTVTGNLSNVVPGTPKLNGVLVTLNANGVPAATDLTDANGDFTLTYRPTRTASYSVSVGGIEKIENATLNPVFGDLLEATSKSVGSIPVIGSYIGIKSATSSTKNKQTGVQAVGLLFPQVAGKGAVVRFFAGRPGEVPHLVHSSPLVNGVASFNKRFLLGAGTWDIQFAYANPGVIPSSRTPLKRVTLR